MAVHCRQLPVMCAGERRRQEGDRGRERRQVITDGQKGVNQRKKNVLVFHGKRERVRAVTPGTARTGKGRGKDV